MDRFGPFYESFRGLSSSTTAEHRYPYDKPSDTTANRGGAASTSSQLPRPAKQHRFQPTDIEETIHTLINHLRHNKHMKQIWEVAVKRNGMTTSLALLSGVLIADTYLYPEAKKLRSRHAVLHANLAPAGTTTAAKDGSSTGNSSSSSSSSSSSTRSQSDSSTSRHITAGQAAGQAPAHA